MATEREELLRSIHASLRGLGLPRERYEEIKDQLVAPGWVAGDLIQTMLEAGGVKWDQDMLVRDRKDMLVELDPTQERRLRRLAVENGSTPDQVLARIVRAALFDPNQAKIE